MIKDCEGCLLYEVEDNACEIHRLKYHCIEECPCGKCLVKMICKNACEDYNEFRRRASI